MRTRRSFSEEFNREAVALIQGSGVSAEQVSADLGISTSLLYRWVRDARNDPSEADRPCYKELEKELARTQRELDFLKSFQLLRLTGAQRYAIIDRWRQSLPVTLMCPLLGVFRSQYYAWIERGRESNYAASDHRLLGSCEVYTRSG